MVSVSARPTTQSALLALAVATLCASGAQAKDMLGGFIQPGQATAAPRGFVEMCESGAEPEFCSPTRPLVGSAALVTAGLSDWAARHDADLPNVMRVATALPIPLALPDCDVPPLDPRLSVTAQASGPLPGATQLGVSASPGCPAGAAPIVSAPTPWQNFEPPVLVKAVVWSPDIADSLSTPPAPAIVNASLWVQSGPCTPGVIASMLMAVSTQLCSFALPDALPPAAPPKADATPTALPETELQTLLKQVNRHVNSRVRQRTDEEIYGVGELWRRSGDGKGAVGDCEDLAIEKRAELVAAGFPADRLAFAVVYSRASGLHTVLVARTATEDVVLDGRSPYVTSWSKVPYSWLSVQSMQDPMLWYAPDRVPSA